MRIQQPPDASARCCDPSKAVMSEASPQARRSLERQSSRQRECRALVGQEPLLAFDAAAVVAEVTVGSHYAMAGDDEADRVGAARGSGGAHGVWRAHREG